MSSFIFDGTRVFVVLEQEIDHCVLIVCVLNIEVLEYCQLLIPLFSLQKVPRCLYVTHKGSR